VSSEQLPRTQARLSSLRSLFAPLQGAGLFDGDPGVSLATLAPLATFWQPFRLLRLVSLLRSAHGNDHFSPRVSFFHMPHRVRGFIQIVNVIDYRF
jgi:hypothetical protein